jgi:hypothetical protein
MHATPHALTPVELSYGRPIQRSVIEKALELLFENKDKDEKFYSMRIALSAELMQAEYDPKDARRLVVMRLLYDMNTFAETGSFGDPDVIVQMWQLSVTLPVPPPGLGAGPQPGPPATSNASIMLSKFAVAACEQPGTSEFQTLCSYVMAEILMARRDIARRMKLSDSAIPAANAEKCNLTANERELVGTVRVTSVKKMETIFKMHGASMAFYATQFALYARKTPRVGTPVVLVPPCAVARAHAPEAIKLFISRGPDQLEMKTSDGLLVLIRTKEEAWPAFLAGILRQQASNPSTRYKPF